MRSVPPNDPDGLSFPYADSKPQPSFLPNPSIFQSMFRVAHTFCYCMRCVYPKQYISLNVNSSSRNLSCYLPLPLPLSLSLYIYIYIYIYSVLALCSYTQYRMSLCKLALAVHGIVIWGPTAWSRAKYKVSVGVYSTFMEWSLK